MKKYLLIALMFTGLSNNVLAINAQYIRTQVVNHWPTCTGILATEILAQCLIASKSYKPDPLNNPIQDYLKYNRYCSWRILTQILMALGYIVHINKTILSNKKFEEIEFPLDTSLTLSIFHLLNCFRLLCFDYSKLTDRLVLALKYSFTQNQSLQTIIKESGLTEELDNQLKANSQELQQMLCTIRPEELEIMLDGMRLKLSRDSATNRYVLTSML